MKIKLDVDLTLTSTDSLIKVVTILLTNAVTDFKINKRSAHTHKTTEIEEWVYSYELSFSTNKQEVVNEIRELLGH